MNKLIRLGRDRGNELAQVLINSQKTRKQNFTTIAEGDGKVIKTYCALGALGCEKNIVGYGTSNYTYDNYFYSGVNYGIQVPEYGHIINAYGLDDRFVYTVTVPYMVGNVLICNAYNYISEMIPDLNDMAHWTFEQIGKFLETLANNGAMKACSAKVMNYTKKYLLEPVEK